MPKVFYPAAVISQVKQVCLEKMEMCKKNVKNGYEKESHQIIYDLLKIYVDNADVIERSSGYAMEYDDTGIQAYVPKPLTEEEEFEVELAKEEAKKSHPPKDVKLDE